MKILHITPTLYPSIGGIETVVRNLMLNLRHQGFIADAMHIAPGNQLKRERLDESDVWRVPLFPNRLVGIIPPVRSILLDYDLLHVHDPHAMALSLNILFQGRGVKTILNTHGGYFHTSQHSWIKKIHWRFLAPMILNKYDEVLACSQADYDLFKVKAPRVKLLLNGVDVRKFRSIDRTNPPQPSRWLYWGRLSKNKRIDVLIDTVAQARDSGLAIDLLIAGADFDGLVPSFLARIDRLRLHTSIRIVGPLSDSELMREMADRSVFITASEHEGFGLSIVEAMAAGLIVICRDMPPMSSLVTPEINGVLVRFDRSASDLSLIKELCGKSSIQLLKMEQSSREAAGVYSWDSVITRYIDVYRQLVPQPSELKVK